MRISGHKTTSVFQRYNIVSEQDLTDAVRKTAKVPGRRGSRVPAGPGRDLPSSGLVGLRQLTSCRSFGRAARSGTLNRTTCLL